MDDGISGAFDANAGRISATEPGALSRSTRMTAATMAVVLVSLGTLDYLMYANRITGVAQDTVGALISVLPLFVGLAMLPVVLAFGRAGTVRLQWTMFSAALICCGVGGIVWSMLYTQLGKDPFPSVADIFVAVSYPLFLVGLVLAIRGYRRIVRFGMPVFVGVSVGVIASAAIYITVLAPHVLTTPAGQLSRVAIGLNIFYPLADCLLLLAPAVTLALLVRQLGMGPIARPWWILSTAIVILAVADTTYAYMQSVGFTHTLVPDIAWMSAALLIGLASFVARDVYAG